MMTTKTTDEASIRSLPVAQPKNRRERRRTRVVRFPPPSSSAAIPITSTSRCHEIKCRDLPTWRKGASDRGEAPSRGRGRNAKKLLFLIELSLTLLTPLDFPLLQNKTKKQASTSAGAMTAPPRALSSSPRPPPVRPGGATSRPSRRGSSRASSRGAAHTSSGRRATCLRRKISSTRPL